MGRAADIEAFAAALDTTLAPLGFQRRKKCQEWVRNYDDLNRDLIHINFGLDVVNPSISVEYRDIAATVPCELGSSHSFAILSSLVPHRPSYDFDTNVTVLATDIMEYGLTFLNKMHDREFAIQSLSSVNPTDWGAVSYSDRIRLLPLLLTSVGRPALALEFVDSVSSEAEQRDQRIPRYDEFVKWIRKWVIDGPATTKPTSVS